MATVQQKHGSTCRRACQVTQVRVPRGNHPGGAARRTRAEPGHGHGRIYEHAQNEVPVAQSGLREAIRARRSCQVGEASSNSSARQPSALLTESRLCYVKLDAGGPMEEAHDYRRSCTQGSDGSGPTRTRVVPGRPSRLCRSPSRRLQGAGAVTTHQVSDGMYRTSGAGVNSGERLPTAL